MSKTLIYYIKNISWFFIFRSWKICSIILLFYTYYVANTGYINFNIFLCLTTFVTLNFLYIIFTILYKYSVAANIARCLDFLRPSRFSGIWRPIPHNHCAGLQKFRYFMIHKFSYIYFIIMILISLRTSYSIKWVNRNSLYRIILWFCRTEYRTNLPDNTETCLKIKYFSDL